MNKECSFHGSIDRFGEINPGIRVFPNLEIPRKFNGFIYITQFLETSIDFKFYNYQPSHFHPKGKIADGLFHNHYSIYRVRLGKSYNCQPNKVGKIYFSDAPHQYLDSAMHELNYVVKFKTYFQYSEGNKLFDNLGTLCSFQWSLKYEAIRRSGQWSIENQKNSTNQDILNSFVGNLNEVGIDPRPMDEASELWKKFCLES